ncbi:MAG TPA: lipopolysaccharide biosynthesis protein [Lachnoclostridium phytofermentans]|uniref:Lipopolysaccharide biosynthesis protein n=1 Tax=Lachnoclostridium phytofermentans TaxID=66219 RepID=A0A3D2X1K7_9FIRM|nr:oligosaccharide flippase family protein [Lachnoclostridium sp.]HCL01039.1 lipopolysaccharide biosynthesis protein [Lachnoclostridium phytofermentans]
MSENFNSKVVKATKWSTITEILVKILSPITNMILARILTPEAFGIVATITMITSLAEIFADAGFQNFLVQHEFKNKEELDNSTTVAFWSNFVLSIFIYVLIFITRNQIARMLGSPELGFAISLASLSILLSTFSGIQIARYRRNFDFKTLFFVRIISSGVPFLVTIPMAMIYKNYWALLIGTLTSNIINAIGLTIRSEWKPRFYFNIKHFKEMFSFSMWTFLDIITMWLVSYTGTFIVGYYLSDYYLGLYKISMTTVDSYMAIITGSTATVLFAALSRLKDNQKEYEKTLFTFQRMISMFVMPMGVGLFLYRGLATKILLGSQWTEAKDFIGLWALISAINVIFGQNISEVFRSKGKPHLALLTQFLHLVVLVPALVITSQISFRALYITRSLVKLEYVFVGLVLLWVALRISFLRILKNVAPTIIASLLMGCIAIVLQKVSNAVIWEFISIFICMLVYFGIILSNRTMRSDLIGIKLVRKILSKIKFLKINEKILKD